jgi:hypothetical protein
MMQSAPAKNAAAMRDKDVRNAVWQLLADVHAGDPNTRLVQEMGIWSGTVRIDIAVINGELSGFELKSDRDTLQRLPYQAELYSKVFDKLTLIVGSRHAAKAQEHIPEWWGITVATQVKSEIALHPVRAGVKNPSPDPYLIAQLLWKGEAIQVLDHFNLAKGWRAKRVKFIHQRLANELPFDDLTYQVRAALKRRPDDWLRQMMPGDLNMAINPNLDPVL